MFDSHQCEHNLEQGNVFASHSCYSASTEQNITHLISNVYIVHSFQHRHITHVIKAETKIKKVVISQFGESKYWFRDTDQGPN